MFELRGQHEGDHWGVEIEADCFSLDQPFLVSVDVKGGWAVVTAAEARQIATGLLNAADNADRNNERVANAKE